MKKIFEIKGMSCNSCARIIERELKERVNRISVSYANETAEIEFDKSKISEKEIKEQIKNLGYEVVENEKGGKNNKEEKVQEKISKIEELLEEIKEITQKEKGAEVKEEVESEEVQEAEEEIEEEETEEPEEVEEIEEEKQVTKTAFRNPWFYVSIIAVILVIVLAYKVMVPTSIVTGEVIYDNPNNNNIDDIGIPTDNIEKVSVSVDDDAFLGNENALVTIIEFSDYQCPFCARFYLNTLPQLKKEYIDTGKVKLVFRDYPLSFHENAQKAAEAAEAARELGGNDAYWKMHDKIFENQEAITIEDLVKYAKEIGLDEKKFKELLDLSKYRNEVLQDFLDGQEAGVQGTPTFFVNGRSLVGAQPFEAFQQIIEEELK